MVEEKTLKDEVKELKDILLKENQTPKQKKEKVKLFRIPGRGKLNAQKLKKNWITVLHLYENHTASFNKYPIEDQTIIIDKIPRLATGDNIFLIEGKNKKPLLVLPSWSVKPTSPTDKSFLDISENYEEMSKKGLNVNGYKILLNRMQKEALSTKKPMPGWIWIVGLAIIGVVVYFLLFKK